MKTGNRKKMGTKTVPGRGLKLLMAAVLGIQMAVSSVMPGTVAYAVEGEKLLYAEEAENAKLSYGAQAVEAGQASGRSMVGSIGTDGGNHGDGTVMFTVQGVKAGKYELRVYYGVSSDNDRFFDIKVNGELVETWNKLPGTGSFEIPSEEPHVLEIEMAEGDNTISFSCLEWYAPNLDRIQIYGANDIVWEKPEDEEQEFSAGREVLYEEEAEDAELTGSIEIVEYKRASGGKMASSIGSDGGSRDDNRVTFRVSDLPAGRYELLVYYAVKSDHDRSFDIYVNEELVQKDKKLPGTGSVGIPSAIPSCVDIDLEEGENVISFGCAGWYAPNLDRIQICAIKEVDIAAEGHYEAAADVRLTLQAEEASLLGGASKDYDSASCGNGGKVNNIGGDGAVLFEGIEIAETGKYAIDVAYAAKEGRKFLITVDGSQEIWMDCPAGFEWDVPNRHIVTCEMKAGTHSIRFGNPDGAAPNLDEIRIYRCQAIDMGKYTFLYDLETGRYDMIADGRTRVNDAFAAVSVGGEMYRSTEYTSHELTQEAVQDSFGSGVVLHSISKAEGKPVLKQDFYLYEGQEYFLTQMDISWEDGSEIGTNYIAPLYVNSVGGVENEIDKDDYFLKVPYDNDGWVKYELSNLRGSNTGYEAAAILNEKNGKALVMGSLSHDTWKTGISYAGTQYQIYELGLYGGAADGVNGGVDFDLPPHGTVTGEAVKSPLMFVGYYDDWRDGMDAYGKANTLVVPAKMDAGNVPFGWNSWGSVQDQISLKVVNGISDYIHDNLQDAWKTDDTDVIYINLDACWDYLSDEEMAEFMQHCKDNGQEVGIYWGPFVYWSWSSWKAPVEGTEGTEYEGTVYGDILLKQEDGSSYGTLDGAYPIDITHPAAQLRTKYYIDKFKEAGYKYIKMDFMVHGALEGKHYDETIQTGTQAYNFGMQYVLDCLDGQMFLNLSIAPTFPYQYADGKRIACDAFYSISNTEYTLNGLTYGFWQKNLYQYPDPDHLVLWADRSGNRASLREARSRATSGILLGTSFLSGDNFVKQSGSGAADERYQELLTNPDIIAVAKTGKIFRPAEISHTRDTANLFVMTDGDVSYLAALNYNPLMEYEKDVDLRELFGLEGKLSVKELWSGEEQELEDGILSIQLYAKDAMVYQIIGAKASEKAETGEDHTAGNEEQSDGNQSGSGEGNGQNVTDAKEKSTVKPLIWVAILLLLAAAVGGGVYCAAAWYNELVKKKYLGKEKGNEPDAFRMERQDEALDAHPERRFL